MTATGDVLAFERETASRAAGGRLEGLFQRVVVVTSVGVAVRMACPPSETRGSKKMGSTFALCALMNV